jgi:hypothetical protein
MIMRYCGLGALQDVDPVDRLNEALQFGLFSLFLDHGADPNANIFWKSSGRLSAFAGFLLAAYYSATTLDMDAYLRTLSAFRHAGAGWWHMKGYLSIILLARGRWDSTCR